MNKTDLIKNVAENAELTKKDAEKAIKAVFEEISQALADGDKVQIIGFGTFEVRQRKAREGRNPRNNEPIQIEASKTPAFKAGKQLKDLVNNK
mgnify:CR=1 FL=1